MRVQGGVKIRASELAEHPDALLALLNFHSEPWVADAVCASSDPDAWWPEKGGSTRAAKAICRSECPVMAECLAYALRHREYGGIWGGMTAEERRPLHRNWDAAHDRATCWVPGCETTAGDSGMCKKHRTRRWEQSRGVA